MRIKEKTSKIDVFSLKNKETVKGDLIIINSESKGKKLFKIKIYKHSENIINIKINNQSIVQKLFFIVIMISKILKLKVWNFVVII